MPVIMSPGATTLLRRLSASSTRVTVALISILIRAQLALGGFHNSPATSAIASDGPSILKSFGAAASEVIFIRLEVNELREWTFRGHWARRNLSKTHPRCKQQRRRKLI